MAENYRKIREFSCHGAKRDMENQGHLLEEDGGNVSGGRTKSP